VATALAGVVLLAGCGSDSSGSGSSSGTEVKGTGSLDAQDEKEIVYLSIGMANATVVTYEKALKDTLAKHGYTVTTLDANFDQAKSDALAQQYLATGKKPAGFIWQPIDPTAGVNASRLLAARAPVLQVTQLPLSEAAFGYAAVDHVETGWSMGELLIAAREKARSEGVQLHSPGGNVLYIDGTPGSPALDDRYDGIMEATKSEPFNIIARVDGGFDSDVGYEVASTAIPQYKYKGIDFIVGFNLGVGSGNVRAAEQNGLDHGKSTFVVTGDCGTGEISQVESGQIYGTVVQSEYIEGIVSARTMMQYLATGETEPGSVTLEAAETEPPLEVTAPSEQTIMAVPPATADNLDDQYWGVSYREACTG
jgi:ABC-type sugar transport system substrate-binding protein